jgi:hypothetical protein
MKDEPGDSADLPSFRGLRTGLGVEEIKQSLVDNLFYGMGRVPAVATTTQFPGDDIPLSGPTDAPGR